MKRGTEEDFWFWPSVEFEPFFLKSLSAFSVFLLFSPCEPGETEVKVERAGNTFSSLSGFYSVRQAEHVCVFAGVCVCRCVCLWGCVLAGVCVCGGVSTRISSSSVASAARSGSHTLFVLLFTFSHLTVSCPTCSWWLFSFWIHVLIYWINKHRLLGENSEKYACVFRKVFPQNWVTCCQ